MYIKVLQQQYWPDDVSTAQHLVDLCEQLAAQGAEVEVIASYRKYEDRSVKYKTSEVRHGVRIKRLRDTGFGKGTLLGRIADFASYNFLLFFEILFGRKPDVFLGLTSPPMVSFVGSFIARLKGSKFCYWTMDLQPELSIRSGLIKEGSLSAKMLMWMGDYVFRGSDQIIVLDKYMKEHAIKRGADPGAISIVPVWPVMSELYTGTRTGNPFRQANDFGDRTVIMYSGNHSYVHPLDTILEAARICADDSRLLFVFIGGGVRASEVVEFKDKHKLDNIVKLPYQPRDQIHISLGSADLQLVVMGNGLTGFTHPNKVYGAMFIGKPILYIGPSPSHVSDLLDNVEGNISVEHGDAEALAEKLMQVAANGTDQLDTIGKGNLKFAQDNYNPDLLISRMTEVILNSAKPNNHE